MSMAVLLDNFVYKETDDFYTFTRAIKSLMRFNINLYVK